MLNTKFYKMKKILSVIIAVIFLISTIPFGASSVRAEGTKIIKVIVSCNMNKIKFNPAYSEAEVVTAFRNNMTESETASYTISASNAYIAYYTNGSIVRKGLDSTSYIDRTKTYYLCYGVKPKAGYDWGSSVKNLNDRAMSSVKLVKSDMSFVTNGTTGLSDQISYNSSTNMLYVYVPVNLTSVNINDLSDITYGYISPVQYNGQAQTPEVNITRGDYKFIEGTDYSTRYMNNVNKGRASVIIIGTGLFTGQKTQYFYIQEGAVVTECQHVWDNGVVTTEPTCITDGVKTFTCTKCQKTKTETISKLNHDIVIDPRVEPTYTQTGLTQGMHCDRCKLVMVEQQVIPKLECQHVWNSGVVTKAATCSSEGIKTFTCTQCNAVKTEPIEKKSHTIVTDHAVAPTYTSTGLTEGSHCSVCKQVIVAQQVVPKLGCNHIWDSGVVTTKATCLAEGVKTFTCTVCHTTKTEPISKAGHSSVKDPGKAPTYFETGLTEGSHCSVCNKVLVERQVIPKLTCQHVWDEGIVTQYPTCSVEGVRTYTCKQCYDTKTEKIDKLAHKIVTDPGYEATTTSTGLTEGKRCSECGLIITRQEIIPKLVVSGGNSGANNNNNSNNMAANNSSSANKVSTNNSANNNTNNNANNAANNTKTADNKPKYSNEWFDGKWYDADGKQTYEYTGSWKGNDSGWWFEDEGGWYPYSQWLKVDGKWYYFNSDGYLATSEWVDGYYLDGSGAQEYQYVGSWHSDGSGWWFEDESGWYPQSQWVWINGKCYYFESNGYLATNKYVDGYWVGADGACQ